MVLAKSSLVVVVVVLDKGEQSEDLFVKRYFCIKVEEQRVKKSLRSSS